MPKTEITEDEREVKDSPMPSYIGKRRISEAVKKVSRTELATELAEATGTNKKAAAAFLESLNEIAYRETKKNGEFTIPGIGKLVVKKTKARMGRNPKTGEAMKIAAKTVVRFRVAKAAKDSVLPPKK